MQLSEILPKLKAKFPAEIHKERKVPGGGTWWYVPWQMVRDRLDQICPDNWSVIYSDPGYVGDYCYIRCQLIICGVAREGVGSAAIQLISSEGKDMARGNPIERATADAFKTAAEQFGVAAYLDDQSDKEIKRDFIRWMQKGGNGKPAAQYLEQERIESGEQPKPKNNSESRPFGQDKPPDLITEPQRKRFWAVAKAHYTDEGIRHLLLDSGFKSTKEITAISYENLCSKGGDPSLAEQYNCKAIAQTNQVQEA